MSHKSVKQECLTRALRNSVKQGCPTRVSPQCVNSGCLTSEFAGNVTNKHCLCLSTYVSAFGFVGFILFFPLLLHINQHNFDCHFKKTCKNIRLCRSSPRNSYRQWSKGQGSGVSRCKPLRSHTYLIQVVSLGFPTSIQCSVEIDWNLLCWNCRKSLAAARERAQCCKSWKNWKQKVNQHVSNELTQMITWYDPTILHVSPCVFPFSFSV